MLHLEFVRAGGGGREAMSAVAVSVGFSLLVYELAGSPMASQPLRFLSTLTSCTTRR